MKQIPNLFTLLNLLFGCLAIVAVLQAGLEPIFNPDGTPSLSSSGTQYIILPEKLTQASLFILLAAVIDFLDGFLARALNAHSEMGRQLDSLADVVSFGVAPSLIVYQFLRLGWAQTENGLNASVIWLFPAFLIACAGAYRLARYNISKTATSYFRGLPIPAAGLLIASFPLIFWYSGDPVINNFLTNTWFWYLLILVVSCLMVSTLPMISMKFKNFSFRDNMAVYILIILSVVLAIFFRWLAVPMVFVAYVLLSLFMVRKSEETKTQPETLDLTV